MFPTIKNCLKLMRPAHWIKNGLVFAPALFALQIFNKTVFNEALVGFMVFCLISSGVYIINDVKDVEIDKLHPKKKLRVLASGIVSVKTAAICALTLFFAAITLNYFFTNGSLLSWACIFLYIALNYLYSIKLKHIALLDVVILASGFLIRIFYGSVITNISMSSWLYITTLMMSFYISFAKRRNEIKMEAELSRPVNKRYTYDFLDKNMYMSLALTIVFYSLWCMDASTMMYQKWGGALTATIPLVLIITMKYSLDVERNTFADPVEILLHDKTLISLVLLYLAALCLFIFF